MIEIGDLEGQWDLKRRIEDLRGGVWGTLQGTAVWTSDREGLRQNEAGMLRFADAPPMPATRSYLWRWDAGRFVVFYDDGRHFHDFAPSKPEAEHQCGADRYVVRYDFQRWPEWSSTWFVNGPRKDMVIETRFRRLGADA